MHQAKRPYAGSQPSITTYFASSSSPYDISSQSGPSTNSNLGSTSTALPKLPPQVQSNLLNVGMRVRKSVPEGYKIGTQYSAFTLFSDPSTLHNQEAAHSNPPPSPLQTGTLPPPPKTRPRAGARELTPFCGILKVGGLDVQQWGSIKEDKVWDAYFESEELDDVPFLSSQGSTVSNASMDSPRRPGNVNKRRFFDEEEENRNPAWSERREEFASIGSVVFGMGGHGAVGERPIAVPRRKSARKNIGGAQEKENLGRGQVQVVGEDVDFEDAEFLDYGLVEGGREVDMSG